MTVGLAGIGVGLLAALGFSSALGTLVYDVQVRDPWTYGFVAGVLTLVSLAACLIPARKASMVDPLIALRQEE